ncbi:unnamed protein product [Kuraishia capsulata CBS 1993]|uniref:Uncharacterized protein n=1 Tax=Kuraishia capsulata CBS 1993 TaxID=1382522 RepID=W6MWJ3_9ASCO|nr:uncharacterized protein KUCA_T00003498001 [Kuraishia capsulata CBS 1993]CDK27520.1 unnamed protein product [Kuraishia capsulata CBS 1993]
MSAEGVQSSLTTMSPSSENTMHSYIVAMDSSTLISGRIHDSHDENNGNFFIPHRKLAEVRYAFSEEQIDLAVNFEDSPRRSPVGGRPDDFKEDLRDNFIILEMSADGSSVKNLTSMSSNWQVHEIDIDEWQFEQTDSSPSAIIRPARAILLKGSGAEMVVENSEENDLVPKADIEYAEKLSDLFTVRSRQLTSLVRDSYS